MTYSNTNYVYLVFFDSVRIPKIWDTFEPALSAFEKEMHLFMGNSDPKQWISSEWRWYDTKHNDLKAICGDMTENDGTGYGQQIYYRIERISFDQQKKLSNMTENELDELSVSIDHQRARGIGQE
jgi:hypothetical protein